MLERGRNAAVDYLARLESLEQDYPQAIDDHVRAIEADCLVLAGYAERASALRLAKIEEGSRHAAFYNDEAKARLDSGDVSGALAILDRADKNGGADKFTDAIRASALRQSDPGKALE